MSLSTIAIILASAIVLLVVLKILSGLLRWGIAIAILAIVGYFIYSTFFAQSGFLFK